LFTDAKTRDCSQTVTYYWETKTGFYALLEGKGFDVFAKDELQFLDKLNQFNV
jgi:hypothetical protein